ncbi:hypothetical protein KNE206_65530 [Kitasatospora sp. NE20-6]
MVGWIAHQPDVVEHPSRTAGARLDVLQQDPLSPEFTAFLGTTPTVTRYHCRDTPDGVEAPDILAEYRGAHPELLPEKVYALARAAGWNPLFTGGPAPTEYTVQLQRSFDDWESGAVVYVGRTEVTVDLKASADGSCP